MHSSGLTWTRTQRMLPCREYARLLIFISLNNQSYHLRPLFRRLALAPLVFVLGSLVLGKGSGLGDFFIFLFLATALAGDADLGSAPLPREELGGACYFFGVGTGFFLVWDFWAGSCLAGETDFVLKLCAVGLATACTS